MKKRREPGKARRSKVSLILGVILLPVSIGAWFLGWALAFGGGGDGAEYLAIAGLVMIPIAFLAKIAIGLYVWLGREETLPVWYWSDFIVLGVLAAVMAGVLALDSCRPTSPPPPPVPPLTLKVVETLEDIATLQLLEDGRVRLRSNGALLGVHDSRRPLTDQAFMVQRDAGPNEIRLAPGETGGIWDGRAWRFISFQTIEEGRARFLIGWLVRPPGRSDEWCLVAPYGP